MATTEQGPMENVERRRVQLEENVAKLRQALKHWQTWELEYEMLKEEIQNAKAPSPAQMIEIGRSLGGSLVNEKEVVELLGKDLSTKRTANQVVDMISRRVDYVQQNISAAEKQLNTAEKKLDAALVLLEPDMENEEGLPLMDIQEELDEVGNVISSSVSQPGKAAPEIVEVLRKTGIRKAEQETTNDTKVANGEPSSSTTSGTATTRSTTSKESQPIAPSEPTSPAPKAAPSKKSVSFSEDSKPDPSAKKASGVEALETDGYNETLADYNFTRGTKVIELDDDENQIAAYPIIPQDEGPEASALRRQMLQYGLSEVGQIVAEIDLEHPTVEYSDDEDEEDYDYDSDEESEEEDQYGRTTKPVLTDEYKQEMMELERKLNARMMENVGPRTDVHPLAEHADDVRTLKVLKDETNKDPTDTSEPVPTKTPSKKGVRFAENLDVSSAAEPAKDQVATVERTTASTSTISDTIVERSGPAPQRPTATSSRPAKVSRFKSSRAPSTQPLVNMLPPPPVSESQPIPQGPSGRTLATAIIEHAPKPSDAQAPDEFDPVVINREIQVDYHKMRNKMIQRQGGFMPSEEDQEDPLMEERDGKTKKVSRFVAARLRKEAL